MKAIILTVISVVLLLFVSALAISYSGQVDIEAAGDESAVMTWFLHNTYERSVGQSAAEINRPTGLNNESRIQAGARSFEAMCVGCHRAPD